MTPEEIAQAEIARVLVADKEAAITKMITQGLVGGPTPHTYNCACEFPEPLTVEKLDYIMLAVLPPPSPGPLNWDQIPPRL